MRVGARPGGHLLHHALGHQAVALIQTLTLTPTPTLSLSLSLSLTLTLTLTLTFTLTLLLPLIKAMAKGGDVSENFRRVLNDQFKQQGIEITDVIVTDTYNPNPNPKPLTPDPEPNP